MKQCITFTIAVLKTCILECNKSTYDLIPGSKEKIEKLSRTIYQG